METEVQRPTPGASKARWPSQIPANEWWLVLRGVWRGLGRDQLCIDAAAISFMALSGIFSAVSSFVAFYGLNADPAGVVAAMRSLSGFVPADVVVSVIGQMTDLASQPAPTLWIAGSFSAIVSLWCAQQGVAILMTALDTAYQDRRTFHGWRHALRSLALAVAVIAGLVLVSLLAIGLPATATALGQPLYVAEGARTVGMILGGLVLFFGLAALYRWLPDRRPPRWRWVRIGAGLVVLFWVIASSLLSVFLAYSNSYTTLYGSLSAVVLLLTLTYVTTLTVLVGGEFNARLEAHSDP